MDFSYLLKELSFIFYKFRHVIIYTAIGFFSILCELLIRSFLISININIIISSTLSIFIGILIAFYLNIKINFFIKKIYYQELYFIISLSQFYLSQFNSRLIILQILNLSNY